MLKFICKRGPAVLSIGRGITLLYLFTLILGCAASSRQNLVADTSSLSGLKAMANYQRKGFGKASSMSKIREMAIKETALSIGAQSSLAVEARIINSAMTKQARTLDAVYNFNALIIEPNILPPVLLEGRQILNLADTQTIRLSDRVYKISKQARFVTTAPTWRQYLWMDYQTPGAPNVTLLPKTKEERSLWQYYAEKGWNKGKEQANTIFQENVARIKEDFKGMILYRKLLAQNMVSAPYVSNTDLGITGDSSEIHIDDKVLRITALPALNTNSGDWHAAVAPEQKVIDKLDALEREVKENQISFNAPGWRPVISPTNEQTNDLHDDN